MRDATIKPQIEAQGLRLRDAQGQEHLLRFDRGGCHQLVLPQRQDVDALVCQLAALPQALVLPGDGGLLGIVPVRENIALALRYHGQEFAGCETMIEEALAMCGYSGERGEELAAELPIHLEPAERWLVGFVRALALRPALLVASNAFAHLRSRLETEQVLRWAQLLRFYYPLRALFFIDQDSHAVPALPGCVAIHC